MALETITLRDEHTGSSAGVLPAVGFNCYSFQVTTPGGPLETLWHAPEFPRGQGKPSGSGIPLLFPFAGRIRGTSFRYDGRAYPLEAGDGIGNAIHGFVIGRPWRVIEQGPDYVTGAFQASVDEPALLQRWPADFRIAATYRLHGNTLDCHYWLENPDTRPLPCALGTHGYFRLPLGGPSADDCRVRVPVGFSWDLVDLLPTGATSRGPAVAELSRGMPAGAMRLDHVFGGLSFTNHRLVATIDDPLSGRTLAVTFGDEFRACVVFNPPHRQAVCIEPYTTVPDPFYLLEQGIDPHLQVLAPGARQQAHMSISVT